MLFCHLKYEITQKVIISLTDNHAQSLSQNVFKRCILLSNHYISAVAKDSGL